MPVNVYNYNLFQEVQEQEDDPLLKLKSQKLVSCRICKGDHWTTKCPYKDTLGPLQVKLVKSRSFLTFGFFPAVLIFIKINRVTDCRKDI